MASPVTKVLPGLYWDAYTITAVPDDKSVDTMYEIANAGQRCKWAYAIRPYGLKIRR
jgi:hypothetical protein